MDSSRLDSKVEKVEESERLAGRRVDSGSSQYSFVTNPRTSAQLVKGSGSFRLNNRSPCSCQVAGEPTAVGLRAGDRMGQGAAWARLLGPVEER